MKQYKWTGDKAIKKYLEEHGFSGNDLAVKLAINSGRPITRQSISQWLSGRMPDAKNLPYLADVVCKGDMKGLYEKV